MCVCVCCTIRATRRAVCSRGGWLSRRRRGRRARGGLATQRGGTRDDGEGGVAETRTDVDFHREWNGEGELFGDGFHGRSHDLGDGFGAASVDFEDAFVVYSQHELTPLEKEFRAESVNDEQDGCFDSK